MAVDFDNRSVELVDKGSVTIVTEDGERMQGYLVPDIGPGTFKLVFRGMDENKWRKRKAKLNAIEEAAKKQAVKDQEEAFKKVQIDEQARLEEEKLLRELEIDVEHPDS